METNSSGDTVLTQWFERAGFEWHPGQPEQYRVLLGLLGNEVRSSMGNPPQQTGSGIRGTITLGPICRSSAPTRRVPTARFRLQ